MYHSITFGDKNTWDDWKLVPTSRPVITPPEPKTNYVDIPGSNRQLDLSEVLAGRPTYNYREGSFEFYVADRKTTWHEIYAAVMEHLHGCTMKMILEDDPNHYWEGRFAVNSWESEEMNSKITIDYHVYPYRFNTWTSAGDWLWDPFSFETGLALDYSNIAVKGYKEMIIAGSQMPVKPVVSAWIPAGKTLELWFDNDFYTLHNGKNDLNIVIDAGEHKISLVGHGRVKIIYRGGRL